MRHLKRTPERLPTGTEAGLAPGTPMRRRRRTLLVSLLAAVTLAGALTAVPGPLTAAAKPVPAPPPPCAYAQANPAPTCPPPPCFSTQGGSGSFAARPCPPPPCNAAATNPASSSTMVVHPCPPPPCEVTPAPGPSGRMAPRPAPCPASRGTVVLTEKDGGRTVTVHAGTRIAVHLSGGGVWSAPASSDGRVVTRTAAARSSNGDANGRFRAAGTGKADLTASDTPRCAPMCKVMSRLWIVHIVVVP